MKKYLSITDTTSLFKDVLSLTEGLFYPRWGFTYDRPVSYKRDGNKIKLSVELPGYKSSEISVEVLNDTLYIKASKENQKFDYSVYLGQRFNQDKVDAKMENGLLEIELVESEQVKGKKILIK